MSLNNSERQQGNYDISAISGSVLCFIPAISVGPSSLLQINWCQKSQQLLKVQLDTPTPTQNQFTEAVN